MESTYGRRGGSSRRHNHGEYQMRGRGSRRGRGGNRRDYADHERVSYFDNRDCLDSRDTRQDDDGGGYRPRGRGGRGRHPAGLKGKEIGLFYARMGREKAKKKDIANRATIDIDSHRERHLSNLLADIRAQDNVRPQPSRSYRDAFEDEEETFKMGTDTEAYGSVPESQRNKPVPDSWDEDPSPGTESSSRVSSAGSSQPRAASSQSEATGSKSESTEGGAMGGGFYMDRSGTAVDLDHDSDSEGVESDRMQLGEAPEDLEYYQEDMEEAEVNKYAPAIAEMYKADDGSDFVMEFLNHNRENRRSNDRLKDIGKHDLSLPRMEELDKRLKEELADKKANNHQFQKMLQFRKKLPSYQMREEILKTVKASQVVVLSGETGCGKTTQVSQFILDDCIERGDGSLCRIVCTQPRRISAISVAERVADERGERCGEGNSVGYQIRLEKKMPRTQGSILYCTTGILLQWLASDPCLAQTTHVILDEIHERDLHSDFLMIILKDVIRKRTDLKVILMSATLNANLFAQYYGNCPMMNIPGFTYPVKEYLLEDVIEMTQYKHNQPMDLPPRKRIRYGKDRRQMLEEQFNHESWVKSLPDKYSRQTKDVLLNIDTKEIDLDLIAHLTLKICQKPEDGAILIFLPGWEPISKLSRILQEMGLGDSTYFRLIPLHSMLPTVNQREVFERPPSGVRKIVIATNIAETSITIDDVVYVIDCGKIKMKNFDAEHNISTLAPEWVSLANAKQRRGRAGRVQPGECYHLYTKLQEEQMKDYQLPEILRTRLEELCLQIKLLKLGMVMPFVQKAMEPPSLEAVEVSVQMLKDLNAFDEEEDLTPLGYHLAKMPVDPQTGKMLLFAAMFSCLDPVLTVAASLSFKDAFYIPMGKEKEADRRRHLLSEGTMSDHLMLANAYAGWERALSRGTAGQYCYGNFMSQSTLRMLSNMRKQFTTLLHQMKFVDSDNPKASLANKHSSNKKLIKACITAGLYPNVAKLVRPKSGRRDALLMTKTERKVNIHLKSVNANEENFASQWFVYHLKMKTARINVFDCTCITPYPLLFFGGKMKFKRDNDQDCLVMDEWMYFKASQRISHLVKELRVELDKLLEYKITHPGVTNWDPKDKEGALMRAILDLITTAEH